MSCGKPPPIAPAAPADTTAAFLHDARPKRFHSSRFELSLPLPDGPAWRIDDHKTPLLVATHEATLSTVTLGVWGEADLMNRKKCEDAAREKGLVHDGDLQTVDDEVIVGPARYDSRVTVLALPNNTPHGVSAGHLFLFGSFIRKCLFVHYETQGRPGEDEGAISERLAVARLQILGGLSIESSMAPSLAEKR